MTRSALAFVLALTVLHAQQLTLPNQQDSVRFAVIGDSGTGSSEQRAVAGRLATMRETFPFDIVLMLGDNVYDGNRPNDYASKFEAPYKTLLDAGVKFFASLGDHDDPAQVFYKHFNMNGRKYYTLRPAGTNVRFVALDSKNMDKDQVRAVADGRIFSGEQAKSAGLVDNLGGLQDAIDLAAERAGISGEPHVTYARSSREPWWWRLLFNFVPTGPFSTNRPLGLQLVYEGPFLR